MNGLLAMMALVNEKLGKASNADVAVAADGNGNCNG